MQVQVIEERPAVAQQGIVGLAAVLVLVALAAAGIVFGALAELWVLLGAGIVPAVVAFFALGGFVVLQPNQASVLIMFGSYQGTLRQPGWWFVKPPHGLRAPQDLAASAELQQRDVEGQRR